MRAFRQRVDIFWTRPTEVSLTYRAISLTCRSFWDAPGKIRTCDLCLRRAALYPLSYGRPGGLV